MGGFNTLPFGDSRPDTVQDRFELSSLIAFLKRHARWIIVSASAALILGLAFYALAPTRYRSVAELVVDPRGIPVSKSDAAAAAQGSDGLLLDLETQRYFLLSRTVLGAVVDSEHLDSDERFQPSGRIRALFGLKPTPEDRRESAIVQLSNAVEVSRGERAYILDVIVTTSSPELSARLANAIARTFLEKQNVSRNQAAQRASQALTEQADQLAEKIRKAEAKVTRYKADHDLSTFDGKLTIEQQISDANHQLGLARTQAADRLAYYEEVKRVEQSAGDAYSLSGAALSPVLNTLRAQYAALLQKKDAYDVQFGPLHPSAVELRQQIKGMQVQIKQEISHLAKSAYSAYRQAKSKEDALQSVLTKLDNKNFEMRDAVVELNALTRNLESSRTLYQSLTSRAKELEEKQQVNDSTSTIISEAVPNFKKSGPSLLLILGGALIFGIGVGSALGYVHDLYGGGAGKPEADVDRLLGIPVLAELSPAELADAGTEANPNLARQMRRILKPMTGAESSDSSRVILLWGLENDSRRTQIAFDLAATAYADGRRVTLVDGDLDSNDAMESWRLRKQRLAPARSSARYANDQSSDRGAFAVASLRKAGGLLRRRPTAREMRSALAPHLEGTSELILISAATTGFALDYAGMADFIVLLLDSAKLQPRSLVDLSKTFSGEVEKIAGTVIVREDIAA
ncbi:hypothetical protein GJ654_16055 [Rhodoblastus acidophilus]|uniref:Polysaccharide chain length determinant N-terminal domain-containing protein n=1 Tax=Rhodoblastus acidophilus TaxID=1074 RepID=A0A6N8DPV2_RHOAC|nr:GumC family protein [Rhodoblastus acidophilus]MCW2275855.1 uncharacterized protein involved in exopolysaccharide biosynthesis [Rhodoblastus acidophilus]MTV32499.1 hypothetical protein [Rhodoblastus acidophilus]